jgi:hypothetical protein
LLRRAVQTRWWHDLGEVGERPFHGCDAYASSFGDGGSKVPGPVQLDALDLL